MASPVSRVAVVGSGSEYSLLVLHFIIWERIQII